LRGPRTAARGLAEDRERHLAHARDGAIQLARDRFLVAQPVELAQSRDLRLRPAPAARGRRAFLTPRRSSRHSLLLVLAAQVSGPVRIPLFAYSGSTRRAVSFLASWNSHSCRRRPQPGRSHRAVAGASARASRRAVRARLRSCPARTRRARALRPPR